MAKHTEEFAAEGAIGQSLALIVAVIALTIAAGWPWWVGLLTWAGVAVVRVWLTKVAKDL